MPTKSRQLPTVSILVTLYGEAGLVQTSLESCLAQRYPNVEIIVVDSGLGSSGLRAARRYEPYIRVVGIPHRINPGLERSIALSHAVGDFVLFQDSQDIQFPDRIAQDVETARQSRADLVVSVNRWLKPGEPTIFSPEPICRRERRLLRQMAIFGEALERSLLSVLQFGGPQPSCVLYRTSIVCALRSYIDKGEPYAEKELLFRALCRGARVAINPRITSARRFDELNELPAVLLDEAHSRRLALAKEYTSALQEAGLLRHRLLREALIRHLMDRVYEPAKEQCAPEVARDALTLTTGLQA
ncbi:MAG TPA: glycosyltransferase family 2 protein [Candidatus Dormibacteraeota bacterium]|nr:glycosyltransferase family 2 protein [Candidatus Dormibacteraeota bacterium]